MMWYLHHKNVGLLVNKISMKFFLIIFLSLFIFSTNAEDYVDEDMNKTLSYHYVRGHALHYS